MLSHDSYCQTNKILRVIIDLLIFTISISISIDLRQIDSTDIIMSHSLLREDIWPKLR